MKNEANSVEFTVAKIVPIKDKIIPIRPPINAYLCALYIFPSPAELPMKVVIATVKPIGNI